MKITLVYSSPEFLEKRNEWIFGVEFGIYLVIGFLRVNGHINE